MTPALTDDPGLYKIEDLKAVTLRKMNRATFALLNRHLQEIAPTLFMLEDARIKSINGPNSHFFNVIKKCRTRTEIIKVGQGPDVMTLSLNLAQNYQVVIREILKMGSTNKPEAFVDGQDVVLAGDLPNLLLISLPGKPLSEVVEMPAHYSTTPLLDLDQVTVLKAFSRPAGHGARQTVLRTNLPLHPKIGEVDDQLPKHQGGAA